MKDKYRQLLRKILNKGIMQKNKKGNILFLINQCISLDENEIRDFIENTKLPKNKLKEELSLYMKGETSVKEYVKKDILWWNYCSPRLLNSYPTYFKELPDLISKINDEMRPSKNYILFIGETGKKTNQLPCLSLIQFQIIGIGLYITVYQRSADSNLGLPCDIYQIYLISKMINCPLKNITFFIGNAHIYDNNIEETKKYLKNKEYRYFLNI